MAIIKESFVADLSEDNYAVVNNNYYRIEQNGCKSELMINGVPIILDCGCNLIEVALCIAIAFNDVL